MCVDPMPRRKDINKDLREAIVAAHHTGKDNKAVSKQFGVRRSIVRKIIYKWNKFRTVVSVDCLTNVNINDTTVRKKTERVWLWKKNLFCLKTTWQHNLDL